VRRGDARRYELLMRRHNQQLYRAVRAILPDASEVEDVMQEAYFAAYCHLDAFAGRARFSTWLVRIAVNVNRALDRLRRSGRAVPFDPTREDALPYAGAPRWAAGGSTDPERELGLRQLVARLESAVEALPVAYRMAWVLREVEGMTTADAARCLGIEEGTLKTRVHRARRLLQEALGGELAAPSDLFRFGGERCDRVVAGVLGRIAIAG
jgi:RNA polymerase sigma-70 factor (ECF subfamily)